MLDLVVHPAWTIGEEDPALAEAWSLLRDSLAQSPHHLVSWSNSGQQALIYAISTDLEAFLETARRLAPSEGVAAFTAKVWESDPRHADVAPQEVALADPQPAWPKPGYGEDVARVLAESQASPQSRRPEPDFHKLVAQFSESTHRLEFELLASRAPFDRELLQRLVSGTLRSLGAMRRAAPAELAPLIEDAESIVVRVQDALADESG